MSLGEPRASCKQDSCTPGGKSHPLLCLLAWVPVLPVASPQILFETFNVPALYLANQGVLSLYASGLISGEWSCSSSAPSRGLPMPGLQITKGKATKRTLASPFLASFPFNPSWLNSLLPLDSWFFLDSFSEV